MQTQVFETNHQALEIAVKISTLIDDALKRQPQFNLVLTGGTLGIAIAAELAKQEIDWNRVRIWFGDERFVSLDDVDRNEAQAIAAWPQLAQLQLVRFPAPPMKLTEAAERFSADFSAEFGDLAAADSVFDLVLLGMGPDGHVASLFPGHEHPMQWIVAEADSPKPPAERLSMSYEALNRSRRVWFVVSGAAKASALRSAMNGTELPAGRVRGMDETLWLLDREISDAL